MRFFSLFATMYIFLSSCVISNKNPQIKINFEKEQDKFEEKLSILKPLINNDKKYDYLYHFSKGSPYHPHAFDLKKSSDNNYNSCIIGFAYDYVTKQWRDDFTSCTNYTDFICKFVEEYRAHSEMMYKTAWDARKRVSNNESAIPPEYRSKGTNGVPDNMKSGRK